MSRDEENKEILIGATMILIPVIVILVYQRPS
jgi:hypothetical protein